MNRIPPCGPSLTEHTILKTFGTHRVPFKAGVRLFGMAGLIALIVFFAVPGLSLAAVFF